MADNIKYLKKIATPTDGELQIKDIEAVSSINGYVTNKKGVIVKKVVIDGAETEVEVQFANEPITETEIDGLFNQ